MRVVVAMSGGVDSSVAAALLQKEGYDVIGATMEIWPSNNRGPETERFGGCCGIGAVEDARKVAHLLGIPHYVMNFRDLFNEKVIDDFCREYSRGKTPNPCIRCNRHLKFDALLARARELDADYIATGHYARIDRDTGGRYLLKKGIDANKDQSYVLYTMTQEQLRHTLFPIGGMTKPQVRGIARTLKLPVAESPESQEICFIPDNNYRHFLRERAPQTLTPGPILDGHGDTIGEHHGIVSYTIGQRHGLGIASPEPLYVTSIDPEANTITVGSKQATYHSGLNASMVNWIKSKPTRTVVLKAKIRYRHQEAEAEVTPFGDDSAMVRFRRPQMAITAGQAVVFYDDDIVVGGGTIDGTI